MYPSIRRTKAEIMDATEALNAHIVAGNTVEYFRPNGDRVIRLHKTDILVFNKDGSITLNSGGWRTVTTKRRMNEFLPPELGIYQKAGQWFVLVRPTGQGDGHSLPYSDGMTIH